MLRMLSVCLLLIPAWLLGAESFGEIRGTVKSDEGELLKGAQVKLERTRLGVVTGEDGGFVLKPVPVGRYYLRVMRTGYETNFVSVLVMPGQVASTEITLKTRVMRLDAVEVRGEAEKRAVTATMSELELEKVPMAVEVLTEREIQEMGALTVADALTEAQGLYVHGDGERSLVASLRGMRAAHTLVLIDGRRLVPGVGENVDLDDLPVAIVERIEVVRGPVSALYGSDAMGGVVNIITRKPTEDPAASFAMRYGQSRYGEARNPMVKGFMAERAGGIGYVLSATLDRDNGYDRYKSSKWTDGDQRSIRSALAQLYLDFGRHHFHGGLDQNRVKREGVRPYDWGDGTRTALNRRKSAFLSYNSDPWHGFEARLRGYRSRYETTIDLFPLIFGDEIENPYSQSTGLYRLSQNLTQAELQLSQRLPGGHTITAGSEYRGERRSERIFNQEIFNTAVYLQDVWQVADPLLVIIGGRYDRHSQFGAVYSPKASLSLSLREGLRLKGSYGKGIRSPSINELYIENATKESAILPNALLIPERSISYEFGLEGNTERFSGDVRFFRNDLREMINTVQVGFDTLDLKSQWSGNPGGDPLYWLRPVLQFQNIDRAMTQGLEFGGSFLISPRWTISDNATLLETEDRSHGGELLNKPDFLNNAKLEFADKKHGFRTNLRAVTVGERTLSSRHRAEAYTFLHLYLSKRLSPSFESYFGINNLLNDDPNIFGFMEGAGPPGTYFYFGLTFSMHGSDYSSGNGSELEELEQ